jgi:hypothetical protein
MHHRLALWCSFLKPEMRALDPNFRFSFTLVVFNKGNGNSIQAVHVEYHWSHHWLSDPQACLPERERVTILRGILDLLVLAQVVFV